MFGMLDYRAHKLYFIIFFIPHFFITLFSLFALPFINYSMGAVIAEERIFQNPFMSINMLFLFLSTVWSRPNSSWLDQQKYTHPQLLPPTLSNQDRAHFLDTANQYLVQKYSSAHFTCTNQSAVHYPFPNANEEKISEIFAVAAAEIKKRKNLRKLTRNCQYNFPL